MKTPKHSLRKIVSFLNNPDEDGGFWLPNIQRPFVWNEEQTCRLFDSTPGSVSDQHAPGLEDEKQTFAAGSSLKIFARSTATACPTSTSPKIPRESALCLMVSSAFKASSLVSKGSYEGRELFMDILTGEIAAPDDVKYKFAFRDLANTSFPWIKFKDLVFSDGNTVHRDAEDYIIGRP